MAIELTPAERKLADRLIAQLEKRSRMWPWGRWIILAAGLAMIGFSAYLLLLLQRHALEDPFGALFERAASTPEMSTPEMLRAYVDARAGFVLGVMSVYIYAILFALGGVHLMMLFLQNWNRHRRDALVAKVLRAKLEEECGPVGEAAAG